MRLALLVLAVVLSGCPVTQRPPPGDIHKTRDPATERSYYYYVPTWYTDEIDWPLVITLHGTFGWDGPKRQTREWGYLAEQEGFIVAAPSLRSVQGILPVYDKLWFKDLARDDDFILALIEELAATYNIDRQSIMLTGFSAGGYPLWYTGISHPDKFQVLVARACNSDIDLFESLKITEEARALPIYIFWGKDDLIPLQDQCWQAWQYLRQRGFSAAEMKELKGGHIRRPEMAWEFWKRFLPQRHIDKAALHKRR